MNTPVEVVVLGSGFAGSLIALALRQRGREVLLIERFQHPRFVIGESTTPLTNLFLEEFAQTYDLPELRPLVKWGSWRREVPGAAVGLKRGFSFYHHQWDQPFHDTASREAQLLVAASPHDQIADTHWYRPDFDHHLLRLAVARGVSHVDQTEVLSFTYAGGLAELKTKRGTET
ncbi:MAG TPA: tryptophan 7-halogenase, partial [Myxococcota bacterium]|nr:tryptophan 7-halogenase [Myxococcota bacterium]